MTNTHPSFAPTDTWQSNTSAEQIAKRLRQSKRVAVLTHAKPDGDAAGSALALVRALTHLKIAAEAWFVGPMPRWLEEVAGKTAYRVFAGGQSCVPADAKAWPIAEGELPDTVMIVDTGAWSQLAELRAFVEPRGAGNVLVDHHMHGDAAVAATRHIVTGAASTTQALAPICCLLTDVATPAGLAMEIAEALYLGLATDTGWFRHSNVTPGTMRLGGDLLEAGVDHTRLFRLIEQQETPGRLKLVGRALSSLQLERDGTVALIALGVKDFDDAGADRNDTAGFADMALQIATVKVAAAFTEQPGVAGKPAVTKISFRSKPGEDAVDVNEVARRLGGGGHVRAAGAKFEGTIEDAKKAVLAALK